MHGISNTKLLCYSYSVQKSMSANDMHTKQERTSISYSWELRNADGLRKKLYQKCLLENFVQDEVSLFFFCSAKPSWATDSLPALCTVFLACRDFLTKDTVINSTCQR
jgi:hypothetical protein